jgi:UDP-N-acetyl-D-glucosamine dehydrogenase
VYHDPYVPSLPAFGIESMSLDEALAGAHIAVIVTAHPDVDHHDVAARLPLVDLRGVTRGQRAVVTAALDATGGQS